MSRMSRDWVCDRLLARNRVAEEFFPGEARRLAEASRRTAERFLDGGRLIAFGRGPYATDAQHVAVEFIHPIVVGKRALPALDLSHAFAAAIATLAGPVDVVMGFGPPAGDAEVVAAVELARRQGALTFALPGEAEFAFRPPTTDPFAHQELIEVLYHTLWETVHVFLEHRQADGDAGAATFLYPFLGGRRRDPGDLVPEVAASILTKVRDDARLREAVARDQADGIVAAAEAIADRLRRGGKAIVFGNGGSATDANDLALDCLVPPPGFRPIPAISLAAEPATVSALANDVGSEVIFLRQLLPHLDPRDVVIGISTSGGSANVIAALAEARKRDALAIGLLGYDGGEIARRALVDHALVVPCDYVPRIQEVQASIYHVLREALEELLP